MTINPPPIEALKLKVAVEVKTSQLPVLTVDPNVHTGAFLTGFYCHFDHPEQHQSKTVNSFWPVHVRTTCKVWRRLTFKCTRQTLGNTSTFWLILTLVVVRGLSNINLEQINNTMFNKPFHGNMRHVFDGAKLFISSTHCSLPPGVQTSRTRLEFTWSSK